MGTATASCFVGGLILLGMGLLRLGFITNFLAKSFIGGFTFAAAVHIASSQVTMAMRMTLLIKAWWWCSLCLQAETMIKAMMTVVILTKLWLYKDAEDIDTDTDTVHCEGHRPIHKEGVGGRGGVNAHYILALMFNDSMDDVQCSSDSTYIPPLVE